MKFEDLRGILQYVPQFRERIFVIALAAVTATWFIVYRTSFGRVVRAGVQNPDMVGALGISLQPYMTAVAALGVGLAGLAGVLLAPISGVVPVIGATYIAKAFITVISGGATVLAGTASAATLLGAVNQVVTFLATPVVGEVALLVAAIILLRLLPAGITGRLFRGGV